LSILLEALRKSEKSQKTHEVPDIHADDQSGSDSESLQTGPLALLLVITLFASGWFVWRQYQLPAGSYQTPVTQPADQVRTVSTPLAGDGETTQTAPAGTVSDKLAGQQRTPVESYQQAVEDVSKPKAGKPKPANPVSATDNRPAINKKPVSGKKASSKPAAAAGKKQAPHEPAPISYWELPDAIRADVPEIRFSVLVYANNPGDRFVLINGRRLGEGDSSQPGLVIQEIRRDGVVFSYRLYRFLVER